MTRLDVYGRAHELDPAAVDAIAARLEARRQSQPYMRMLHDYLDGIDLGAARDVLALGAGTGVEVRALIGRSSLAGRVVAIEISERLIEIGRRNAEADGAAARIDCMPAMRRRLTFPMHPSTSSSLTRRSATSTSPFGFWRRRFAFSGLRAPSSSSTATTGMEDAEEARRWDERIIRTILANSRVMRSMPRLYRRLGIVLVGARAYAFNEIGSADFFLD